MNKELFKNVKTKEDIIQCVLKMLPEGGVFVQGDLTEISDVLNIEEGVLNISSRRYALICYQ